MLNIKIKKIKKNISNYNSLILWLGQCNRQAEGTRKNLDHPVRWARGGKEKRNLVHFWVYNNKCCMSPLQVRSRFIIWMQLELFLLPTASLSFLVCSPLCCLVLWFLKYYQQVWDICKPRPANAKERMQMQRLYYWTGLGWSVCSTDTKLSTWQTIKW